MKIKFLIPLAALFICYSCSDEESKKIQFKHVEIIDLDHGVFGTHSIIDGMDAHSGKKFSRTDSANAYGIGYSYLVPDSLKQDSIFLKINAWVRKGDLADNGDIVVSITSKDSILLWLGCDAKNFVTTANTWAQIDKTFALPIKFTSREGAYVNVMSFNNNAKKNFDVDDLIFELKNQ